MTGGTVLEACHHPKDKTKTYVNVGHRSYKKVQECAIYVARCAESDKIEIGDQVWWHGRFAYWTPQYNCVDALEAKERGLKQGVDYDVKIRRIGFSGVDHPVHGKAK